MVTIPNQMYLGTLRDQAKLRDTLPGNFLIESIEIKFRVKNAGRGHRLKERK